MVRLSALFQTVKIVETLLILCIILRNSGATNIPSLDGEKSAENSLEAPTDENRAYNYHHEASREGNSVTEDKGDERPLEDLEKRTDIDMSADGSYSASEDMITALAQVDDKALVRKVLELMQMSKTNTDVITQAFRFVKLDAHLATLLSQLSKLRESHESLQSESVRQQTKFNLVLDEIRSLASSIAKESLRLTQVEERLESEMETMNDRLDSAIEKMIQSSVSTQILLDLSKETIQQTDKSVGISNEVLSELKSVRTELGDVGQASVQTIYKVQKLEESLLTALEESRNKTIYALRQDDGEPEQLEYQLLPLALKMDGDETSSSVGNGSAGNFMMQADGRPESTTSSLPAVASASGKNDEKVKAQQDVHDRATTSFDSGGSGNSGKFKRLVTPHEPCPERQTFVDHPRNCEEVQMTGHTSSGTYRIYPFGRNRTGVEVFCDLSSEDGGWTVVQRRQEDDEPLNFHRSWEEYAEGFGSPDESHWLGLDVISELTRTGDFQLRIEMTDWDGEVRLAEYAYFRVANASQLYKLFVTDYSGDAGDSLAYHNGMAFTTKDKDNDLEKGGNCAERYHGAWWYKSCHQANLNGLYMAKNNGKHESYANGVNWYSWRGYYYSLKRTEMKIRSRHFQSIT